MVWVDFEERRREILELVIEAHVITALPVGSELVARKLHASISPATIRHIMVELEEAGFLEQPHTSAGRVPTDRGWRFYVDAVMDAQQMAAEEFHRLALLLEPAEADVERLFRQASDVLSELTQLAAFAMGPTVRQRLLRQVELVPLGTRKLLTVLVADGELITSRVIELDEPMSKDETAAVARFLNAELSGLSCDELLAALERRLLAEGDAFYHMVKRSCAILQHLLAQEPAERFYLEGASYLVAQPEFSRAPEKASALLRRLDAADRLLEIIRQDLTGAKVQVRIGRELEAPELEDCGCVAAPILVDHGAIGAIGVLGPKRMSYPRIQAVVEGMARCVAELIASSGTDG
jgi:heat-inducible transcriptional repressor